MYGRWYREHQAPELLAGAVYGLPELYREQIRGADLVANPGCYPTASLLALAPLARAGVIEDVVIDAKSGVSGAGRTPSEKTHFVTADENVNAYGVPSHRHIPGDRAGAGRPGRHRQVTFVPHLVPLDQGELVSCYVTSHRVRPPTSRPSTPRPTTRSRSSNSPRRRRECATSARRTSAASRCTATGAPAG